MLFHYMDTNCHVQMRVNGILTAINLFHLMALVIFKIPSTSHLYIYNIYYRYVYIIHSYIAVL